MLTNVASSQPLKAIKKILADTTSHKYTKSTTKPPGTWPKMSGYLNLLLLWPASEQTIEKGTLAFSLEAVAFLGAA